MKITCLDSKIYLNATPKIKFVKTRKFINIGFIIEFYQSIQIYLYLNTQNILMQKYTFDTFIIFQYFIHFVTSIHTLSSVKYTY